VGLFTEKLEIAANLPTIMDPRAINIAEFSYNLPDEQIARFPLAERDASKLLVFKQGSIAESTYQYLPNFLPENAVLVFNDTKVVEARLLFQKPTGGQIEIFCLEPGDEYPDIVTAMQQTKSVRWKCLVGGAAKWKHNQILTCSTHQPNHPLTLQARLIERLGNSFLIELDWGRTDMHFADVLHQVGNIPIPPYLKRASEASDEIRYQTIYAKADGSVAAPTAGLHFTPRVFEGMATRNINACFVTLHVGAGTFKPVSADQLKDHDMHSEFIDITATSIRKLMDVSNNLFAVGTTSLRTLESMYWMGVKVYLQPHLPIEDLPIQQWEVYDLLRQESISVAAAFGALLNWMEARNMDRLITTTQILIAPGYTIKTIQGLITNFHQPQSTLLLLIAALIGDDWKKVYDFAVANQYRFLSYGDGCLLMPKENQG
jgi:S-adenosylmethionine:tRNA ribosyltransferase-isomerase